MTIYSGSSHWKWWFSIAMLNYWRVFHSGNVVGFVGIWHIVLEFWPIPASFGDWSKRWYHLAKLICCSMGKMLCSTLTMIWLPKFANKYGNVVPGFRNPGWLIVVVPPKNSSYWNFTSPPNQQPRFMVPDWLATEISVAPHRLRLINLQIDNSG